MTNYTNIVGFLLTTYLYYQFFKPVLSYEKLSNPDEYKIYISNTYVFLAIYLLAVMIIQTMININVVSEKCGGSVSDNVGYAGLLTILPWTLIFGVLIIILTIFPGFKSAFSDVIGYYWVSSSANKIITELLVSQEIQPKIDADNKLNPQAKKDMQTTADAIIKICGNSGVLINQMTPQNFDKFWSMLTPLMKPQYQPNPANKQVSADTTQKRNELFNLVQTRDNVGEAMWYVYTGLLVTSIVQLNISSKGCKNNVKTMEENYKKFKEAEEKSKTAVSKTSETTYTL